jgi:hypothetical protein
LFSLFSRLTIGFQERAMSVGGQELVYQIEKEGDIASRARHSKKRLYRC